MDFVNREVAPVTLAHFKLLRVIGKGGFGKVNAVMKKDTKQFFALKEISKHLVRAALNGKNESE